MIELITYLSLVFCGTDLECQFHIKDCMLDGESYQWCTKDWEGENESS